MADITDQEAIAFANNYIRPMCETLRYVTVRGEDWAKKWSTVSSLFPNDTSELQDGRDAEGISKLTAQDINNVAVVFNALLNLMDESAKTAVAKPCVRPLLASNIPSS